MKIKMQSVRVAVIWLGDIWAYFFVYSILIGLCSLANEFFLSQQRSENFWLVGVSIFSGWISRVAGAFV